MTGMCNLLWAVLAGLNIVAGAVASPCSIRDATDAVRKNPMDVGAYVTRAACYLTPGPNNQKPPLKSVDAAVKDLEQAIKLDPRNFYARHNYAHAAYLLGYQKIAVDEFTKAITLDSRAARSYMGRGWAYLQLCRFKEAAPDFQRAVSLDASLQSSVATRQQIANQQTACSRPAIAPAPPNRANPYRPDPYFDHNSDYWRLRRWEERPH